MIKSRDVSAGQEGSRLWESNPRPTHYEDDGRYPRHSTSTDRTSDATESAWPPGRTPTEMPERMPTPTPQQGTRAGEQGRRPDHPGVGPSGRPLAALPPANPRARCRRAVAALPEAAGAK